MSDLQNSTEYLKMTSEIYRESMDFCNQTLRYNLSDKACIIWHYFVQQKTSNKCAEDIQVDRIVPSPIFDSECGSVEMLLLRYAIPELMLLCVFGNLLNLLIYNLSYFDGSTSVVFLRAKAIFNIVFVCSRILEIIYAYNVSLGPWWETVFWQTRQYAIVISNISGTMSTWLTLLVTVETVMCVLAPFTFRQYCTRRMTFAVLFGSFLLSSMLHSTTLLITEPVLKFSSIAAYPENSPREESCWYMRMSYRLQTREQMHYVLSIYAALTMAVSIVIPTVAMLICSLLIIKQFTFKELGESFSQRRKCVIRMTVATTLSHLLLEGPATLTHGAQAILGSNITSLICVLNQANNLLSVVNATIPFFVFLMCNEQFKYMTVTYLKGLLQSDGNRRKAYMQQAVMRCNRASRVETERSFVETKLISKTSNNV